MSDEIERWFPRRVLPKRTRLRLVCLPYAGGGAAIYRGWEATLPVDVELCAVELPGRWARVREPAFTSMRALVDAVQDALALLPPAPTALFGYSLGALAAFELARRMPRSGVLAPIQLFVSARRAPRLPPELKVSHLPEDELLKYLTRRYFAIPAPLLEDPEMRGWIVRTMRADLGCVESFTYEPERLLECPLTAFGGTRDGSTPAVELNQWSCETQAVFTAHLIPGDHFFINTNPQAVVQKVAAALSESRSDTTPELLSRSEIR